MQITILKSKIGHAVVTEAELHYEGSITIDSALMEAVDIIPGEQVQVLNTNNGERFMTYVIEGEADSGVICLNGPAARLGVVGDTVMILSYGQLPQAEAKAFVPKVIHLDKENKIKNS